jgi:hypothetical protein
MGGRRAKRKRTPPITEPKKLRNGSLPPPPNEQTNKNGRQCLANISPFRDEKSLSGESYYSDTTSISSSSLNRNINLTSSSAVPKVIIPEGSTKSTSTKSTSKPAFRIPPIFVNQSSDWCKVAPIIFSNSSLSPEAISAQVTYDGSIIIKTHEISHYRLIQKI